MNAAGTAAAKDFASKASMRTDGTGARTADLTQVAGAALSGVEGAKAEAAAW